MIELDHLFLVCRKPPSSCNQDLPSVSSEVARVLSDQMRASGFCEGPANTHAGQGTANRRFFFSGFMLEFLYAVDSAELGLPANACLGLTDRFSDPEASVFGVCSRSIGEQDCDATYEYTCLKPSYLPPTLHVQVASGIPFIEPLWFHLPFVHGAMSSGSSSTGTSVQHDNGASVLTGLVLESPFEPSSSSQHIADMLGIKLKVGTQQAAHLEFDHARNGHHLDIQGLTITF